MSIKKHKDYEKEVQRLNETMEYMEHTIEAMEENRGKYHAEIKDAYVHLDHTDSSLSYSSIMLHTQFLDELEKNYDLIKLTAKKPYFARIDVRQADKKRPEKLYIGKVSLYDPSMETPLVVDWRAPIASIYYDGRIGETTYQVGEKDRTVDLSLKRQYTILEGQLESFMDVDISTTDTFLQATLHNHAGQKLKDIVSTIQSEQNRIIRADMTKPLIVQGVAGSGKTTIALHRIAYLLYTYADTYYPEQFMILAPNSLFLDYISSVLPELGAHRVQQTTYVDLMQKIIGKKLKLTDASEKLNELIRTDAHAFSEEKKKRMVESSQLKNSMEMKQVLDAYLLALEDRILPNEDVKADDKVLYTKEEVKKLYYESYAYLPFYKRVASIQKYLTPFVRNQMKVLLKEMKNSYNKKIDSVRLDEAPSENRRRKVLALIEERDARLERLKNRGRTAVKKYIGQCRKMDTTDAYTEVLLHMERYSGSIEKELCAYVADMAKAQGSKRQFELEDLASLAYIKEKLYGLDEDLDTRMVFIDEAQDFSNFQFFVLKDLLKTEKFTILGDLSQGIHMYRSLENWDYLRRHVFQAEPNYLTLEQSYRTTVEIMEEANYVLKHMPMEGLTAAKPVVRHGEKPEIYHALDSKDWFKKIRVLLHQWREADIKTIAIIAKSAQEAKKIHQQLKKTMTMELLLVEEKTVHFDCDTVVIPAHLAKGLEFDAVIVASLEEHYAVHPLDVKLMYVAMTRAMHKMAVVDLEHSIAYYKGKTHHGA